MRIWVFRTAGKAGGDPDTSCPTSLNQKALHTGHTGKQCVLNDYQGDLEYILNDLVENMRLRQGWGVPTLDLRLPEAVWIENYIIASNRYWNETSGCEHATGRRNILKSMLDMTLGDTIIIPNVNLRSRDESFFTTCNVNGKYFFEDRSHLNSNWEKDFGHVIPVTNIKAHRYGKHSIERSVFGPPYMHAIDEVKKHFQSCNVISEYVFKGKK